MKAYFILMLSILLQVLAAFLALRLVWITKRAVAWTFIASAIVLMSVRRCFTLYEWHIREMALMPVDIGAELVGLATSVLMLAGVALAAPVFQAIKRSEERLRERVEERTAELKKSYQALQLELSERQQAEAELRRSEVRFRTIADFTYNWEYWLAPDGSLFYNSPACQRITGFPPEDFVADPGLLQRIVHADDQQMVIEHHQSELASKGPVSMEFRILTRDGEVRWIGHVCQPVYSPTGRYLGRRASNRELTQRKKAEEEKAKLESRLRQAQKMEAVGTLAGGIAHDFNNILSPIIMYTEIALRDLPGDSSVRPYLEQVLKSSQRATDLVKQILTVSRKTERQQIWMQIGPIIKESLKFLRASLPTTIDIRQEIASEWDWIVADPTEIYQVIMNLCTNAAHAMEDKGGVLEVKLDNVDLSQEQSAFGLEIKPGPYIRLTISDTGQGIGADTMERIFEPYFTTKEMGQGTGLGLALVHGIIKTCGGGINITSEPSKRTIFQVFFPPGKREDVKKPDTVAFMPRGKERILLVDDEADIVAAAQIILQQLGYEVVACTRSREALEIFKAAPERVDLIFTDQTMPQLTGLELAQECLRIRPHLPIIICTGYGQLLTPDKAKAAGIRELILKPIIPLQLAETVRRALDSRKEGISL